MNDSITEATPFDLEPTFLYPVVTCYLVISLVAFVGNLSVCYAILADRKLRDNPTKLLLLSLAISDLLTVTIVVPFDIESLLLHGLWKHGEAFCISWLTVYLITVSSSILTLLAISVDRYNTLRDPLARFRRSHFMTKKRAVTISLLIWIYCILWSLLPTIGWRDGTIEPILKGACVIPYTKVYHMLSSLLNFILPLLVTCLFYILIYRIARNHGTKGNNGASSPSTKQTTKEGRKIYLKNIKAAKTTSMFVLAIFFCWQPYAYFSMVVTLGALNPISYEVFLVLLMLGYLNSALNPFLFTFQNKHFKAVLLKPFSLF
ncbi:histamine H1 receptor-like [Stylophora pistillata]|uniref:histamine H1 receptor-like n=1 Tax=Stylophora pistillata TaxID=50429 RepID=UPI000C0575E7|nr:histamine H1 receptor-like [Stylophora pistillata]